MGLTRDGIVFLLHCRGRGVDFRNTATIGRQVVYATKAEVAGSFRMANQDVSAQQIAESLKGPSPYAESLLSLLGAKNVDSFDASAYEHATIVTDFNDPISESHKAKYSVVIDGGSLEHVFNYPQGLKNAMEMVAVGGHLILITPTHSRSGHGFYQISAELFHRTLSDQNGYEAPEVLVSSGRRSWYQVIDPAVIGTRIGINPRRFSDHLYICARRTHVADIFASWPQQSDYVSAWRSPSVREEGSLMKRVRAMRNRIPHPFIAAYHRLSALRASSQGLTRVTLP